MPFWMGLVMGLTLFTASTIASYALQTLILDTPTTPEPPTEGP